jgi:hypothetical protein
MERRQSQGALPAGELLAPIPSQQTILTCQLMTQTSLMFVMLFVSWDPKGRLLVQAAGLQIIFSSGLVLKRIVKYYILFISAS